MGVICVAHPPAPINDRAPPSTAGAPGGMMRRDPGGAPMARFDLLLATCRRLPDPDPDAAPLGAALAAAGLRARWAVWDDPAEDWRDAPMTLIRSTWDYWRAPDRYLAWARHVDAVARLENPAAIVRWNLHKRYLAALADAGLPAVPTVLVGRGEAVDPAKLCAARGWSRVVIKPAVSAGSHETHAFAADAIDPIAFDRINRAGDLLIQPFVASVESHGERSLIAIDGEVTHAIRKAPRWSGGVEAVTGPVPIEPAERALAHAALGHVPRTGDGPPLYGRVDLVRDAAGAPMVAEIEVIEPSLFFPQGPAALERLVAGLAARLGRAGG